MHATIPVVHVWVWLLECHLGVLSQTLLIFLKGKKANYWGPVTLVTILVYSTPGSLLAASLPYTYSLHPIIFAFLGWGTKTKDAGKITKMSL